MAHSTGVLKLQPPNGGREQMSRPCSPDLSARSESFNGFQPTLPPCSGVGGPTPAAANAAEMDLWLGDLGNVVCTELGVGMEELPEKSAALRRTSRSRTLDRVSSFPDVDLNPAQNSMIYGVLQRRSFIGFFMALTLFAIYVPDLDRIFGNKKSAVDISIATTVVILLFALELVLQCVGRKGYLFSLVFWLDVVAFASLLPETYVVQQIVLDPDHLIAGSSSYLTRMIRLVTTSAKISRLSRLARVVRAVSLVPRVAAMFGRGPTGGELDRVLNKKLRRVFLYIDEDAEGVIPRAYAIKVLTRLSAGEPRNVRSAVTWCSKVANESMSRFLHENTNSRSVASRASPRRWLRPSVFEGRLSRVIGWTSPEDQGPNEGCILESLNLDDKGLWARQCSVEDNVTFDEFKALILENDTVSYKLRKAAQKELKNGNNMHTMSAKSSESMGVKVAMIVLLMLFVMGLIAVEEEDGSLQWGLKGISSVMQMMGGVVLAQGAPVPSLIQDQVQAIVEGGDVTKPPRRLLYLDLQKQIFCCSQRADLVNCDAALPSNRSWGPQRPSFDALNEMLRSTEYRRRDLLIAYHPEVTLDSETEEIERNTISIVVCSKRAQVEEAARVSILTTSLVIVIILGGIYLLSSDLTFISMNLLKPLRGVADEMESIVHLKFAGITRDLQEEEEGNEVSEVRLIRKTFENMKRAIKSWGKYVPWPVVHMLLHNQVDARLNVKEKEVTIFLSDIASFTTIVENLTPDRSLLLLTRYFSDMSKIIDEHGGIVIEFIGDAIMSIYGAPMKNPEHPASAVKSACRMLTALRSINRWAAKNDLPQVRIRCGLHTATVLVGNMGFTSRIKYGVVGDETEVPGMLEELNKQYDTELLISHSTRCRLGPDDFLVRPIDRVHLRKDPQGGRVAETIYQVFWERVDEAHEEWKRVAGLHAAAMELYGTRDFGQAAELFRLVGTLVQCLKGTEDKPSSILLKRCLAYIEDPPRSAWDGVWDRGPEK